MITIKTKRDFTKWLNMPNEEVKINYLICTHYGVGEGMLHLKNLKLLNLHIRDKHFESTEFKNCLFKNCEFTSSFIVSCTLIDCEFIDCTFTWCEFLESDFINVRFNQCRISALESADIVSKNLIFQDCNEIIDFRLRGTYANREISFVNCYIEFLIVDPIEKDYIETINFTDCIIQRSNFTRIDFSKSKFIRCSLSMNQFSDCLLLRDTLTELNETPGKEYNSIDFRTILNSTDQTSQVLINIFGIHHSDIKDYVFGLTSKIEFQSIFISYSFNDKVFAKRINDELLKKGIITFLWEKDSPAGQSLTKIMTDGVRKKDRVLFIASKDSLRSKACQFELSEGRSKQEKLWEDVLFPIHIDNYLFSIEKENIRPKEMQEEYWKNITELRTLNSLDFSQFLDSRNLDKSAFDDQIYRLVKGLRKIK